MGHNESPPDGRREDASDRPEEGRERGPGGDYGLGDYGALLGDPATPAGRVRLRCPEDDCDQTGSAADYRRAYWPKCRRHHKRMVLAGVG